MIERLLPRSIDNAYRAHRIALWLLGLVAAVKTVQSVAVFIDAPGLLRDADGVPVQTFPAPAAQAAVALFAISAFSRLLLALAAVGVLIRYRGAAALMFALLIVDYLGRELVLAAFPLGRVGNPMGPYVNFGQFVLMIMGLALALRTRQGVPDPESGRQLERV